MSLTIGSLFSGYGGLDQAVEQVTGAQSAWFCEWEDAPSKVLASHYPHVPNHRDVTTVDWEQVEPVDIITGGSPCQDLSNAGKRAGMTEGTRSNLWVNMREAIATIRPQLVVWENVQGALSAEATSDSDVEPGTGLLGGGGGHLRALGRVLGDLAEIGYDTCWTTVRASDVGAPHHRARVFLVAWPQEVPDPEGCGRDNGQATHDGQADREVHSPRHDSDAAADPHVLGSQAGHVSPVRSCEEIPVTDGGGEALPDTLGAGRHERGWTESGEATGGRALGESDRRHNRTTEWGQYAPAVRRWERVVGPAPAPTELNRNNKPRLSAAFAEWMMGLPAGWVTDTPGLSRADMLKMLGNGVVPQQAAHALHHLLTQAHNTQKVAA